MGHLQMILERCFVREDLMKPDSVGPIGVLENVELQAAGLVVHRATSVAYIVGLRVDGPALIKMRWSGQSGLIPRSRSESEYGTSVRVGLSKDHRCAAVGQVSGLQPAHKRHSFFQIYQDHSVGSLVLIPGGSHVNGGPDSDLAAPAQLDPLHPVVSALGASVLRR